MLKPYELKPFTRLSLDDVRPLLLLMSRLILFYVAIYNDNEITLNACFKMPTAPKRDLLPSRIFI